VSQIRDTKKPTQQSLKQAFVSLAEFIERPQADFKSALILHISCYVERLGDDY